MPLVLSFRFDELPLVARGPTSAADVSGTAEILCHPGGGWRLRRIQLDGFRRLAPPADALARAARDGRALPRFVRETIELEDGDPIFLCIRDQLTRAFRDQVDEEVSAHLAGLRRAARDAHADHRRKLAQSP